jgi:general stress protein 26
MKKLFLLCAALMLVLSLTTLLSAQDNRFLYTRPGDKPPVHVLVDEEIACVKCHPIKTKDIDGYSSATISLTQSKAGVLPKKELENRIVEVLSGKKGREIYALSTSYHNKPLNTIIEFVIDPETLTFYSVSEKQTEKLFHIHENSNVSLAYVKPAENYFKETLGVQIVGKAELLTGKDPEYAKGLEIYLPSLLTMIPGSISLNDTARVNAVKERITKSKIITKITPERIVLKDFTLKAKGLRLTQIWKK